MLFQFYAVEGSVGLPFRFTYLIIRKPVSEAFTLIVNVQLQPHSSLEFNTKSFCLSFCLFTKRLSHEHTQTHTYTHAQLRLNKVMHNMKYEQQKENLSIPRSHLHLPLCWLQQFYRHQSLPWQRWLAPNNSKATSTSLYTH